MKALFVPAALNEPIEEIEWSTLEDLQTLVEGYIETVPFRSDVVPYFNEEGKIKGLDENLRATAILSANLQPGDYIAGNAIFVGSDGPEETDIPQAFVTEVLG